MGPGLAWARGAALCVAAAGVALAAATLGAAALPADPPAPLPSSVPGPSIVLVTLDTFRADRLAALGGPPGLTPFLDALAATSTVFVDAVTPVGQTHPAHASLLTGLHPGSHGLQRNGHRLAERVTTLAEMLRARGYRTGAFVQAGAMLGQSGLVQGFESHVALDQFHAGHEVLAAASRWLEARDRSHPLFLWVHYFETHTPYLLTPHSRAAVSARGGPLGCGLPHALFLRHGSPEFPATPEVHDVLRILYDGHAAEADRLVRDTLGAAASAGALDDALLVVAADHGQLLGEHGATGYGDKVWQEAIHVPLLVRLPRHVEGRLVPGPVSLVDVVPTLLAILGAPPPAGLDGRSLLPALRGEALPEAVVLCGTPPPPDATDPGGDPNRVAALLDRYKVIVDAAGVSAYDLRADPGEAAPLALEAVPEGLRRKLLDAARAHQRRDRPRRER